MTPAKQQRKTTRMPKAETDQDSNKLTSHTPTASKTTPKKQTKSDTPGKTSQRQKKTPTSIQQGCNITFSEDTTKFPYETFPYRLEHLDKSDKKICWFMDEDHVTKYIERYGLKKKEYTLECSFVNQTKRKS